MGTEHTYHDTSLWKDALLETLRVIPIMSRAARKVGIHKSRVYQVMQADPAFKEAVEAAQAEGDDTLEVAAFRRGVKGVDKGVWHNGVRVGSEKVYSDTLLIALLRGRKKGIYAERTEVTGPNGEPLIDSDTARETRLAALLSNARAKRDAEQALEQSLDDLLGDLA